MHYCYSVVPANSPTRIPIPFGYSGGSNVTPDSDPARIPFPAGPAVLPAKHAAIL